MKALDYGKVKIKGNSPQMNSDMEPPHVDTLTKENQGSFDKSAPIVGKTDTNKFGHSWDRGKQ